MMNKRFIAVMILSIFSVAVLLKPQAANSNSSIVSEQNNKIKAEMKFSTYTSDNKPIEGVDLILVISLVNKYGKLIGKEAHY